jgi:hypothetical protein
VGGLMQKLLFILIAFIAAATFIRAFDHGEINDTLVSSEISVNLAETSMDFK